MAHSEVNEMSANLIKAQNALANAKTSHIFHLIMSIITAGFWIPIWLLMGIINIIRRKAIERRIDTIAVSEERVKDIKSDIQQSRRFF